MWKAVTAAIILILALSACGAQDSSMNTGAESMFAKSTRPVERSTEQPADMLQAGETPRATKQPEKQETEQPKKQETQESEQDNTGGTRVGICHLTGSQSNPYVYIQVSQDAVPAHQAHGDILNVSSADACPTTAPAASGTPGAPGNQGKGKGHGGPPEGKGPNGNGNGQGKDKGNGD